MSRWVIVRHGETSWNAERRIQGQTDVALSDNGLRQAAALQDRLATWDIHFSYASDLLRTMQTAHTILQGRDLPIQPTPEIREFAYGRWEGMTGREARENDPALYAELLKGSDGYAPPGGESLRDVMERVGGFVSRLKEAHPRPHQTTQFETQRETETTLLIVGHGGALRVLLTCLLELPTAASRRFSLDSASLTLVDCFADNAVLRLFNDTSHWSRPGNMAGQP